MIPVYNLKPGHWLSECIESVLIQDKGADWAEIVVVDDASNNDRAEQIAKYYGSRVTYRRNPENLGIVGNHNNCLKLASGKFIHILHQDDYIENGFYNALLEPLSHDDQIVAGFTNAWNIDGDGKRSYEQPRKAAKAGILENWFVKLAQRQRILFPSIIVRRSAYENLGGFSPALVYAFDWEMWGQLAASGKFWYEPKALARYRSHDGSVTNSLRAKDRLIDAFRAIAYLHPLLPDPLRLQIGQIAVNRLLVRDWRHLFSAFAARDDTPELQQLMDFLLQSWSNPNERNDVRQALENCRLKQPRTAIAVRKEIAQ